MKTRGWLGIFAALALVGVEAKAQSLVLSEPFDNQMEFVRNLRRKGHAALANEYLDLISPQAAKGNGPVLAMERARNSLALAKEGRSADAKTKLLEEARGAFEGFVKANPSSPAAAQARGELAKLLTMQALTIFNKALAEEDEKEKEAGARKARDLYDQADAEFSEAVKVLNGLAATDVKYKAEAYEATFDRANNLLDKAMAYVNLDNSNQNRQRAETVDAARKLFVPISKDSSNPYGLMANAFLVKCYQEMQDPPKVAEHAAVVFNATGKVAEPAQRTTRYFDILYIPQNIAITVPKIPLQQKAITKWLQDYPAAKKLYQGEHLRHEFALNNFKLAYSATDGFKKEKLDKLVAKEKTALDLQLQEVEKLAKDLELDNGDLADRARSLKNAAMLERQKLFGGSLKGFEGTLLAAQIKFSDGQKTEKADVRSQMFREGMQLLKKAVAEGLAENAPLAKVHDAQFKQGAVYVAMGDLRRGAIAFEDLARTQPPSKKGAEAAGYAVELYKKFVDSENDATARMRLRDLSQYALSQKLWKEDKVIGSIQYFMALDYQAEEKFGEALQQLESLPKDYAAYTYAQAQALFIALKARDAAESPEDKAKWVDAAKKARARMGSLPAASDATTTLMWFMAACESPKFLYADSAALLKNGKLGEAEKTYKAMTQDLALVQKEFDKSGDKLAGDKKDAVGFTLKVLDKYARLGQADVEYRKGSYAAVMQPHLLGPTVAEVFKAGAADKKAKIKVKDVRVIVESLSLALRSLVQVNNANAAKELYGLMLRVDSDEGGVDSTQFTRSLVRDLADQVKEISDSGNEKALNEMTKRFSGFADDLAKELVYTPKKAELGDIITLSRFYGSLKQFKKASDLFKVVPRPPFLDQKGGKFTEAQESELITYWSLQINLATLQRQAKEYKEANRTLAQLLAHPNAKLQTLAEKEQIHIYEDMESWGNAIKLWKNHMEGLQRAGLANNQRLKELYFEAYYHNAWCYFKYSQSDAAKKSGKTENFLSFAANQIVRLEVSQNREGWNIISARFHELLAKEPILKAAYDPIRAKAAPPAAK